MKTEIIKKLKAKDTGLYPTHNHLIENISCYEIIADNIKAYFSELDVNTGEDLRSKGIISFYLRMGDYTSNLIISIEMMVDKEFVINEIKNSFKDIA